MSTLVGCGLGVVEGEEWADEKAVRRAGASPAEPESAAWEEPGDTGLGEPEDEELNNSIEELVTAHWLAPSGPGDTGEMPVAEAIGPAVVGSDNPALDPNGAFDPGCHVGPNGDPALSSAIVYAESDIVSVSTFGRVTMPNPIPEPYVAVLDVSVRTGFDPEVVVLQNWPVPFQGLGQVYQPGDEVWLCVGATYAALNQDAVVRRARQWAQFDTPSGLLGPWAVVDFHGVLP